MKAIALVIGMACGVTLGQDRPVLAVAHVEPAARSIPVPALAALNRTGRAGGLIVEDMKLGEGSDVGGAFVAHYQGTLRSDPSKVFDSSFVRGEPGAFSLAGAFPGWQSGIPGMKVGGIRRLTVPAAMVTKSPRADIPADADLVYVVQVVDVLRVEDVKVGAGELTAGPRCVAITAYTITDKDGRVVEEHRDPYIWFADEYRPVALGLEGMKVGGKRRIHVPAAFNEPNPKFKSTRPERVPVTIEVELLGLKNVPPAMPGLDDGC